MTQAHPTAAEREAFFEGMAELAKALAHPVRLRIVSMLSQGPRPVEAIARRTGQSMSTTSAHLHKLKRAGVVASRRRERQVIYSVADHEALGLWVALQSVAERNQAGLTRLATQIRAEAFETRPLEEVVAGAGAGEHLLIDLRGAEEFAQGHLPYAVNVPAAELETRLDELPRDRPVVIYCRGLHCVALGQAHRRMLDAGIDVRRFTESAVQWRHRGVALEQGAA